MSIFDVFARLDAEKEQKNKSVQPIEWIVAGLGNPGKKYENTRHNTGFRVMDTLCRSQNITCDRARFQALTGETVLGGSRCLLIKPQTFMNLSGQAVQEAASFYKIPPERIIVIFDDISLPVGTLRIRPKGSAGGQNGVKNIISCIGSQDFPRIKVGIGAKPHPDYDLADWVLSSISPQETESMNDACSRAALAVSEIIQNGTACAAQKFNGTKINQK